MSELSRQARAAARKKAERFASADPHERVDGSSWTPAEPLNAEAKTGLRPISRRQFRRGGKVVKVEGEHTHHHAGRKPRKSGGRIADELANTDVREANGDRAGPKHRGGFADGGVPTSRFQFQSGPSQLSRAAGLKRGGHADASEDRALVKKMVKPAALERKHGGRADAHWIKGAIEHPGALHRELRVPEGKKIPAAKLSKAEHSTNALVAKRAHLAETLRSMHHKDGGEARQERKDGGRAGRSGKGKMNVNIIIGGGHDAAPMGGPMAPPAGPPKGMPVPVPPPMPPQGMPMGAGMPPGMPMGAAPPMAPPMPRKSGGRAYRVAEEMAEAGGSGGGLGRLEKIRAYGDQ